jgi:hypothetical protein
VELPFSFCARDRVHHVDVRLVVLQRPDGLLSVEAAHLNVKLTPPEVGLKHHLPVLSSYDPEHGPDPE